MEDSVAQKRNQREFALASLSDLSSSSSSSPSPGIARFTCDGSTAELQIQHESHQISLTVDLRDAQVHFSFCLFDY